MTSTAHELLIEQWAALSDDTRLVFVHPNYIAQHLALPLLDEGIYVRFSGSQLSADDLETQMQDAIAHQGGSLAAADGSPLILDECDRAAKPQLDLFLKSLPDRLRRRRALILCRYVPSAVVKDAAVREVSQFIPVSEPLMLWDYTKEQSGDEQLLEVRVFGEGRVQRNGEAVEQWDGLLPRALFFFLVDRGMVTRDEIFETFWPTLTPREATNVFHVTKRKISEVLGVDLTTYWSGFYHIEQKIRLSYDAALFTQMIQDSAIMSAEAGVKLARQAIDLYRSDFLTSIQMGWTERRRQDLRQMYSEALITMAKTTERLGQPQEALGLYLQASVTHRQREDVIAHMMRLYQKLDMADEALSVYNRHRYELEQTLQLAPARHLQELAAVIQNHATGGV